MSDSEEKIISLRIFISELLRNEFKAACARQGRNMSEVVADFAKDYVERYGSRPLSHDRPEAAVMQKSTTEIEPAPATETKAPSATKANRGKGSKEAS